MSRKVPTYRRFPAGSFLPLAVALVLSMALLAPSGPAGASPSVQTGTEQPSTPDPTPSPTPSPADAELAADLARLGEYQAAIAAYRAVLVEGDDQARLAVRRPLARVYLDDDQVDAAVRQLDVFLFEAPPGTDVRPAQLLLAEALALRGDWEDALALYDAYIVGGGGAATYARLGRATALAELSRGAEAVEEAGRVLGRDLPDSVRLPFVLRMAQTLEAAHPEEALDMYERLHDESRSPADQALALWRSALIERDLGDVEAPAAAWAEIIRRFPETATAQEIVHDPPASAASELDSYYPGLVRYRAGDDDARAEFEASLALNLEDGGDGAVAARSSFYLAVLDERAGDDEAAIDGYARVLELDSTVDQADDAAWWRARLLESDGRITEAATSYRELASTFPDSVWAPDARIRLGLLSFDAGRFEAAADEFEAASERADDEERERALLWQGKALAASGEDEAAEAVWTSIQEARPYRYYGLRAAVLLGDADGSLKDAGLEEEPEIDWPGIEEWLVDATGASAAVALETVLYNQHWALGQELSAVGMSRRAGAEFGLLLEQMSGAPAALYQLTRFFHTSGRADLAARAATRLIGATTESEAVEAPDDLWRVAYPAAFLDALRPVADGEDVPDVLLLALVRQESFFDPLAGSSAGALGLTQVIESTGDAIADELGVADFETEDLFRPAVSLRFGAHYLAEQLDLFDENIYHSLAAYNGGPGNVLRWTAPADGDLDRFVEEISFAQTKAYVRLVAENLARYRQLYLGLDRPELPAD